MELHSSERVKHFRRFRSAWSGTAAAVPPSRAPLMGPAPMRQPSHDRRPRAMAGSPSRRPSMGALRPSRLAGILPPSCEPSGLNFRTQQQSWHSSSPGTCRCRSAVCRPAVGLPLPSNIRNRLNYPVSSPASQPGSRLTGGPGWAKAPSTRKNLSKPVKSRQNSEKQTENRLFFPCFVRFCPVLLRFSGFSGHF